MNKVKSQYKIVMLFGRIITPSGRLDVDSSKSPLERMLRLSIEPVGLRKIQEGGRVNNTQFEILLTQPRPLHTTSNFAPNEYIGVFNPSGLAVYKVSNARDNDSDDCN